MKRAKVIKLSKITVIVFLVFLFTATAVAAVTNFRIEVRKSTDKHALIWVRSKDKNLEDQNVEFSVNVNGISEWITLGGKVTRNSSIEVVEESWVDTLAMLSSISNEERYQIVKTENPVVVNGRSYNFDVPTAVLIKSVSDGKLMDLTKAYNQTLDVPYAESSIGNYRVYTYHLTNEYYVLIDEISPAKGSVVLLLTERIVFNHLFQRELEPHINLAQSKTNTLDSDFYQNSILKSGNTVSVELSKKPLSSSGIPLIAIIGGLIGAGVVGVGGFLGLRKRNEKVDDILGKNPTYEDSPKTESYDGPKEYTFPDGSFRREQSDGSIVGRLPDGTTFESKNGKTMIYNKDGSTIASLPDGTYIERIPHNLSNDQIITTYPDGTTVVTTEGSNRHITHTPDGRTTIQEPDGSTKTYDKNDQIIEATTPEGDRAVRNDRGTFDLKFKDGTQGTMDVNNNQIKGRIDSKNGPIDYSFNKQEMTREISGPDFSFKETPRELNINTPDKSLNLKHHESGKIEYNYREGNYHENMQIDESGNTKLNIKNKDGSHVEAHRSNDGSMQMKDSQGSNIHIDKSGNIEGNINSENGTVTINQNQVNVKMNDGTQHQLKRLSDGSFTPIN